MNITFQSNQVVSILDDIGIKHNHKINNKSWIPILCPYHNDKSLGSAFVHTTTGAFNCYSCKTSSSLVKMVQDFKGLTYQETLSYIGAEDFDFYKEFKREDFKKLDKSNNQKVANTNYKVVKRKQNIKPRAKLNLTDFDPSLWKYTKDRCIDREWIDKHNVKLATTGRYKDFMIIPIVDKELGINTWEARKLKEYEYLVSYYNQKSYDEEELKAWFKKESEYYELYFNMQNKRWEVWTSKEVSIDPLLIYLMHPKTLYPDQTHKNTIWNRESLDLNKDVVITEGLAAICRTSKIVGENIGSVMGSKLSENQFEMFGNINGRILIITDNDIASDNMIEKLDNLYENIFVIAKTKDDKELGYEKDLEKAPIIEAKRYLYRRSQQTRTTNETTKSNITINSAIISYNLSRKL